MITALHSFELLLICVDDIDQDFKQLVEASILKFILHLKPVHIYMYTCRHTLHILTFTQIKQSSNLVMHYYATTLIATI